MYCSIMLFIFVAFPFNSFLPNIKNTINEKEESKIIHNLLS